jgi:hypothetical protein
MLNYMNPTRNADVWPARLSPGLAVLIVGISLTALTAAALVLGAYEPLGFLRGFGTSGTILLNTVRYAGVFLTVIGLVLTILAARGRSLP